MPESPGVHQPGKNQGRGHLHIKEAIEGYIKALEEDGLPIPEERFESMLVA